VARDRHLKSPALGRHRHSSSSQRVTTAGLTCEITFPIPEITAGTFPGLAPDRNVTVSNLSPQTKSGVASHGASWWVDDEPLAAADLVTLLDEVATRCWVQWEQLALRVLSLTSTSSIPRFLTPTLAATLGDGGRPSVICNDQLEMFKCRVRLAPVSPNMANFGQGSIARGFLGQRGESILLVNAHSSRHCCPREPQGAVHGGCGDGTANAISGRDVRGPCGAPLARSLSRTRANSPRAQVSPRPAHWL